MNALGRPIQRVPINELVGEELAQLEEALHTVTRVEDIALRSLLEHILRGRGKRLRPAIAFLTTRMLGADPQVTLPLAAALELLHTATLIHDDLVDNAMVRRGHPTLNAITSTGVTVLVGDYMFACVAEHTSRTGNTRVMSAIAKAVMIICSGELRQVFNSNNLEMNEAEYYRQINSKTAALFGTASETAALLAGRPTNEVALLREYGIKLGMSFQITDDVLDFVGDQVELGKPVGGDLRQGIVTLPVIYALQHGERGAELRDMLRSGVSDDETTAQAIALIDSTGALEKSYQAAERLAAVARGCLSTFEDSVYRQALLDLTEFAVSRQK